MSKKTHTRQDAEKQYLLTFETFKHAVPQTLQKFKGNVNSLDIWACTSLERETVAPLAVKHHTQPATALQRDNICHKYRDITTLLTALDWPIKLKTRLPIRKRRMRHPRQYWSVHWDWHPAEQFLELSHAVCLQEDWGDRMGSGVCELSKSFGNPTIGKPICTRFRKYEQVCRHYSHVYQTRVHCCFHWKIRGCAPCETWYMNNSLENLSQRPKLSKNTPFSAVGVIYMAKK